MTRHIGGSTEVQTQLFERINRHAGAHAHRFSLKLPDDVSQQLPLVLAQAGYGAKQKSLFVEQTARQFLDEQVWVELGLSRSAWKRIVVDLELVRTKHNVHHTFQVTPELYRILWRASIRAALFGMRQDPPIYLEISIASVLRAALLWRLGSRGRGSENGVMGG